MKFNFDKRRIGIDIDDTKVDFVGNYLLFYNQKYKTNLKKEDMKFYNINPLFKDERTSGEPVILVNEFYESKFFKEMVPLSNSIKVINELKNAGYDLVSITSRPDFLRDITEKFLNTYFSGLYSDLFFSYNHYTKRKNEGRTKAEICVNEKVTDMVDDSLEYCKQCTIKGVNPLLFGNYSWNQDGEWGNSIRVKNWLEVEKKLLK